MDTVILLIRFIAVLYFSIAFLCILIDRTSSVDSDRTVASSAQNLDFAIGTLKAC